MDTTHRVAPHAQQAQLDLINQELADAAAQLLQVHDQESLTWVAFRRLRQGQFSGGAGLDACIVAAQGGVPLDFLPSWPPDPS